MNIEELREYCLGKENTTENLPFGPGTLVFSINGKIYLLVGFDRSPLQFNVKCDPEFALEIRERHPCILPGYHMNKKHWNTVIVDGSLSDQMLRELIDHSYDLVKNGKKKKNSR